jgi:hypothetical protein
MPSFFRTRSFESLSVELDQAIAWLSSLGMRFEATRIAQYQKDISALNGAIQAGSVDELLNRRTFPHLVNSINEASELVFIYRGLGSIQNQDIKERLAHFIKGPVSSISENADGASHTPRDIGFELCVASLFALADYSIDFHGIADLRIIDDSKVIFIECKRPSSVNSIQKNVRKAIKQLRKRYLSAAHTHTVFGLAAISMSKVLKTADQLLISGNELDLNHKMGELLERFVRQHERHWQSEQNSKTIGALVHLQVCSVIEAYKILTPSQEFAANNIVQPGTDDYNYLLGMRNRLQNGLQKGMGVGA